MSTFLRSFTSMIPSVIKADRHWPLSSYSILISLPGRILHRALALGCDLHLVDNSAGF
ncbi:MAG: hypothetical protein LBD18_00570 [Treponema sp.]|nr:hypothetical protein [Treponema sp.]